MKLLFIRHGDPDYDIDSLTEKGRREAEYLAERMAGVEARACYVSPLGRARDTAAPCLKRMGMEAEVCPWLREFPTPIRRPDRPDRMSIAWDWLPQDWMADDRFFRGDQWFLPQPMAEAGVKEEYDRVTAGLDQILARHGYHREGRFYRVRAANNDTLIFFCHFGVTAVLLSHLLNMSPMILWHGFCAAPTSVTTAVTEERREGVAAFRVTSFGDISHLSIHGEPPAFSARFRECYANDWERLD